MASVRVLLACVLLSAPVPLQGCAASSPSTAASRPATVGQPTATSPVVEAPTTYVTPTDAATMAELFERARAALQEGRFSEAAASFDRLVNLEPKGIHASASLFNAGIAYEAIEDRTSALARFREVVRSHPQATEVHAALVRAMRLLVYQEQWTELTATADHLLAFAQLAPIERLEAHGCRALGAVAQGDLEAATSHVARARTLLEDHRLDDGGRLPVAAASAFFALGETRRLRGEKIVFVPVPAAFAQVLEDRCQLLLDAQDAYATAMRSQDAHWAAMSGYRVGQLYQQLHRDVLVIPPPSTATTDKQRQLFEGAMRLRYRVLVEKGLTMMERVLRLAERTGEHSAWVSRAREARDELQSALAQEKEALAKLPFSEADLKRALDDLSKKSGAQASP